MAISQRTPTSGTAAASASFSITLPASTAAGDMLVLVIGNNTVTSGPAAPLGWTRIYSASAGSSQCCSVYTAQYITNPSLSFTNVGGAAAWACNAFFEASRILSLDVAAVAATNTTSNTTLPTGAPTTGSVAGDYEVLLYTWTSAATISTTASGSTIDRTQANSTSVSVALGHNNTASLPASTPCTAFSQTLSAANTRKTGVGVLLKSTVPATRQMGGFGVLVDLEPPLLRQPRLHGFALLIDYVPGTEIPLTVSATQAQSVSLAGGATFVRAISQAQTVSLDTELIAGEVELTVTAEQATAVTLELERLPTALSLEVETTQPTEATLAMTRGASVVVSTTQATAVTLRKLISIRRQLVGSHRIQTRTSLLRQPGPRIRMVTQSTVVRLVQQVRLTRATETQPTSTSLSGLPVQLVLLSTVQTRSMDLARFVWLMRSVVQATLANLQSDLALTLTLAQPTDASRHQAIDLTRPLEQAQAVSLEVVDVTPYYEIVVTASVSQAVTLGMSDTGAPAKRFVVDTRRAEFVVGQRAQEFAVPRRGVRFVAGVR